MRVAPRIRIPARFPILAGMAYVNDPTLPPPQPLVAEFSRHAGPDKDIFYECDMGCSGCGCQTFSADCEEIPEDVLEHLTRHANLCPGMFPAKLPA